MTDRPATPPRHLRAPTRRWWASVAASYALEPHHVRILTLAAEAWDRGEAARLVIDRDGMTYVNRFGEPRPRPEVAVERDSRVAFARLVRELGLDLGDAAPSEGDRPPRLTRGAVRTGGGVNG